MTAESTKMYFHKTNGNLNSTIKNIPKRSLIPNHINQFLIIFGKVKRNLGKQINCITFNEENLYFVKFEIETV